MTYPPRHHGSHARSIGSDGHIKVVVFDMDGVLCRNQIERRLALLASWSGSAPDAIRSAVFESGFEDEAERGSLTADEYLTGFGERIGYPLTAQEWVSARRMAIEPDLETLSLARELRRELQVAMFTNNPLMLKRHFRQVFPLAAEIFGPNAVFSAELGARKPDAEAFRRLASRLGATPGEILFFDDWSEYVEGARAAGLEADHFHGPSSARESLARHGVIAHD